LFRLTAGNTNSVFPAPPAAGTENKFLSDQKADAFLAGSVMDFHGRYYVTMKLYAVFTRSVIYEDSIIFSAEDIGSAMDEITRKLIMTISGGSPASIIVKAEPEDALVLINRSFAARGDTGAMEYPPGKYTITASAPDHESITVETELAEGDIADIKIFLRPLEYTDIEIPGTSLGGTVYHGSLYVGEAPLTLRLPVNTLEYIEMETSDGKKGTAVFQMPELPETGYSLPMRTSIPVSEGSVDRERRAYYWAWGGTWVTGIAAWLLYYTFSGSYAAYEYRPNANLRNEASQLETVSTGFIIAAGVVAAYHFYRLGRYLYVSNRGATPVTKLGRN
jgi:hypothetical protein